jgi:hypothetical protein
LRRKDLSHNIAEGRGVSGFSLDAVPKGGDYRPPLLAGERAERALGERP